MEGSTHPVTAVMGLTSSAHSPAPTLPALALAPSSPPRPTPATFTTEAPVTTLVTCSLEPKPMNVAFYPIEWRSTQ